MPAGGHRRRSRVRALERTTCVNRNWGCAERHSGCLRSASGQRLCGSAAHGLIVRGCATQSVALKRGAEAPGPRNGRASAATASWPALDSSLEQRRETVRTVLIRDSRFSRSAGFRAMRGSMTALHVGTDGGRLWRGAHECPPAVIAGGRECAPSNELPTEIEIGKCAERHSGCLRSESGQRSFAQPRAALPRVARDA